MARFSYVIRKLACPSCGRQSEQVVDRSEGAPPVVCSACQVELVAPGALAPKSPTIVDDVLWGGPQWVHNIADKPIFVETKTEYRALLAAHGMKQKVRHVPVPGTDKSPVTTSWNIGPPPGVDPRPFCMLTPDEQRIRRQESAERLGYSVEELNALEHGGTGVSTEALRRIQFKEAPRPSVEFIPDKG